MLRLDGSILWANVSVSPVMDVTGRPQSAVSVYVDITQRKQAEDRLALLAQISELTRAYDEAGGSPIRSLPGNRGALQRQANPVQ